MTDKITEQPKKRGRPKGSRSKSELSKTQIVIDNYSAKAIKNIIALAENDKKTLNTKSDVPMTVVLAANKIMIDKAISNEKEKLDDSSKQPSKTSKEGLSDDEESKVTQLGPRIYSSAKE